MMEIFKMEIGAALIDRERLDCVGLCWVRLDWGFVNSIKLYKKPIVYLYLFSFVSLLNSFTFFFIQFYSCQ